MMDGVVTRDEIEFFVKEKVGLLPTGLFNVEVMISLVELAFSDQGKRYVAMDCADERSGHHAAQSGTPLGLGR